MTRQFCIQVALWGGLLGAACVQSPSDPSTTVRFAIPAGATRVAVLGTAEPNHDPPAADPIGRPRNPAGLALWSRGPDRLVLVDVAPGTKEALATLLLPRGFRRGEALPVDAILLTDVTDAHLEGLRRLSSRLAPESGLPVVAPPGTLDLLLADPALGEGRIALHEPAHGEVLSVGVAAAARAFHVPLEDGRVVLGYGFEGAERRLLYLPRLGPLERLAPPLVELAAPAALILLDGRRYRNEASPGEGSFQGTTVTSLLTALDGLPIDAHAVFFTSLVPGNPLLDPTSRESRLLEAAHRALLLDGTEWWL